MGLKLNSIYWIIKRKLNIFITYSLLDSFGGEMARFDSLTRRTKVTAVPIPLTTIPDSPSKSKHWWYPITAFPPSSKALRPIFRCTSPDNLENKVWRASFDALGVLILSILYLNTKFYDCRKLEIIFKWKCYETNHWYSGSSLTTSSSTKPSIAWALWQWGTPWL